MKVEINSGKGKKYCTFMYQKMVFALADKKVRFPHSSLSLKNTFFSSCHQVASISYVSFICCQLDLLSPNIIREYIRIIPYSIFAENPYPRRIFWEPYQIGNFLENLLKNCHFSLWNLKIFSLNPRILLPNSRIRKF